MIEENIKRNEYLMWSNPRKWVENRLKKEKQKQKWGWWEEECKRNEIGHTLGSGSCGEWETKREEQEEMNPLPCRKEEKKKWESKEWKEKGKESQSHSREQKRKLPRAEQKERWKNMEGGRRGVGYMFRRSLLFDEQRKRWKPSCNWKMNGNLVIPLFIYSLSLFALTSIG